MKDRVFMSFSAHIPRVIHISRRIPFICSVTPVHTLDVLYQPCCHVRPPGLEPGTAGSKPAVISISPRAHLQVYPISKSCYIHSRSCPPAGGAYKKHNLRIWSNGMTTGCQSVSGSSILPIRTKKYHMQIRPSQIPPEVVRVTEGLEKAGFEAWIVGGCVRDLLLGRTPKDWDVTTNAAPEQIQAVFPHTYYTNEFGTVGVVNDDATDERLKTVEVTPYRLEGKYSDARRPDSVEFSQNIEDDLKRRDFTINALAYSTSQGQLLDPYDGIKDMGTRWIRAVGEPKERFDEDALRIMRAVRIAAELDFTIEPKTAAALGESATQLEKISKERIRDEFMRILNSSQPMKALILSHKMGILKYIAPELETGIGVEENQAHSFDVFEHNIRSVQHAADKDWSFIVRLSALFHDLGKPNNRRWSDEKRDWTFHGHDVVGARMTKKILENLKFSRETIDKATSLVRWHMFFSDQKSTRLNSVRRILANVGKEHR